MERAQSKVKTKLCAIYPSLRLLGIDHKNIANVNWIHIQFFFIETMAPISPGLRVMRGPDWSWDDQDGGEGCVGTVVSDSNKSMAGNHPEGTALVRWDHGKQSNYRVGHLSTYDLRLVDNGSVGVKHVGKRCKYCNSEDVIGVLWSCTICPEVILCTKHYMSDKACLNHQFLRVDDRYGNYGFEFMTK